LAAILLENNWMVLEVEDSEDFYLVVAEKKRN